MRVAPSNICPNPQDGYLYLIPRDCDLSETCIKCPPGESIGSSFACSTHYYLFAASKNTTDTLLTWDAMQDNKFYVKANTHLDYSGLFYCVSLFNYRALKSAGDYEDHYYEVVKPALDYGLSLGCVVMGEIKRNKMDLIKTNQGYRWATTRQEVATHLRG